MVWFLVLRVGFQPTRPLRGATNIYGTCHGRSNFNPRAPCGARLALHLKKLNSFYFNPRAPCGARRYDRATRQLHPISTHAPLAGRDRRTHRRFGLGPYFNPRAPCGARRMASRRFRSNPKISTHAPLAGRDLRGLWSPPWYLFQPTRPLRGATHFIHVLYLLQIFQPTRPLRGATNSFTHSAAVMLFQPTRPLRGAT